MEHVPKGSVHCGLPGPEGELAIMEFPGAEEATSLYYLSSCCSFVQAEEASFHFNSDSLSLKLRILLLE